MPCHDMALHCHVPAAGTRSRPSTPHRCSMACCGACRRSRACAGSTAAWRRGRTMSSSIPSPPSTPSRRDLPAHSATGDDPGWKYMCLGPCLVVVVVVVVVLVVVLYNKNPPTPCLWQAPASTQKTKRKTRPAIRRSARWRVGLGPCLGRSIQHRPNPRSSGLSLLTETARFSRSSAKNTNENPQV